MADMREVREWLSATQGDLAEPADQPATWRPFCVSSDCAERLGEQDGYREGAAKALARYHEFTTGHDVFVQAEGEPPLDLIRGEWL